MKETGKSSIRRTSDHRYASRWLVGSGIDIGAGDDPLVNYSYLYPRMKGCMLWDIGNGDAEFLRGQPDNFFDFVHSSHCLEHLNNPTNALENWIRVCKSKGHLVITVPDEDLYEHQQWPSTKNGDHKHTFTLCKQQSWSPASINVFDLLKKFVDKVYPIKIELVDYLYNYNDHGRYDQTYHGNSECAIEIILKKY